MNDFHCLQTPACPGHADQESKCFDPPLQVVITRPTKSYPQTAVSFDQLREANLKRLPVFKNKKGKVLHKPDGSDWLLTQWANALQGENGELAELILVAALTKAIGVVGNEAKKLDRADFELTEALRNKIAGELADVATYLDILAYRCGINLGIAVAEKFNEVSERVGCDVWMQPLSPRAWIREVHDEVEVSWGVERPSAEGWVPLYSL